MTPPPVSGTHAALNQDGQAMGSKGQKTRRRLIDATASLLEIQPLHDIRVADIARGAATSAPTFYLYFKDVADAALAAISEHSQSTPQLLEMIGSDWQPDPAGASVAFVRTYVAVWTSQGAIFRARNLAAEEDPRFYAAREQAVRPLLAALAARIARNQAAGLIPADLHPNATAGVLIALLERLAAIAGRQTGEAGITTERTIAAAAYVLRTTVEGSGARASCPI
jgi:AcrR family transcriptional regulator